MRRKINIFLGGDHSISIGTQKAFIEYAKKINKENSEAYKIVYSTRKAGERTELKFSEIDELAELITEHKNPKIAELALNAKKQNGTNNYFHSLDEVKKIIENPTYPAPTVKMNPNVTNFYDFTVDDFELVDYNPYKGIKGKVAV